tara:strand:+ start:174 stop:395 length:222 start_codon:yes stop_codon:yes gene_type:complete
MGVMKWHQMKEMEKEDERAREHKIQMVKDGEADEDIFELSNVMCEGGCGEYMTVRDEEAGWGMCVSCKFEAMD